MKHLIILKLFILFFIIVACENEQNNKDETENNLEIVENEAVNNSSEEEEEYNPFKSTVEGTEHLNNLLGEEGWRSAEKYYGDYVYFKVSLEAETTYDVEWDGTIYEAFSDGSWITLYTAEEMASVDIPMGECYSVKFRGTDTFEISHIHMCAVNKDNIWETYIRNTESNHDEVILDKSSDPEDIKRMFQKIKGKYIECEFVVDHFRKMCFPSNITKNSDSNEDKISFWIDFLQDGFEFKIKNVTYDPGKPNTFIFESSRELYGDNDVVLTFRKENNYKTAELRSYHRHQIFIHENDYAKIEDTPEPCGEMEGDY